MADITGAWLGTYWQAGSPTRFEATFVQAQGSLSGRISDDSPLGEAQLQGQLTGRQLSFTKRYFQNSSYSIDYVGTLSEDGNHISGRWSVNARHSGPWEAHRSDDTISQEFRQLRQKRAPLATSKAVASPQAAGQAES